MIFNETIYFEVIYFVLFSVYFEVIYFEIFDFFNTVNKTKLREIVPIADYFEPSILKFETFVYSSIC